MQDLPTQPLVQLDRATVVKGGKPILQSASLEICAGQHTAILGPNGSGKSTLIKLLTREHYAQPHPDGAPPTRILGEAHWDIAALRAQLGVVSADLSQAFASGSVQGFDVVLSGFFASEGVWRNHTVTDAMRAAAEAALTLLNAGHLRSRRIETLSTGEARRLLIARALAPKPLALILDEPTAGLDPVARQRFVRTLRRVAASGCTVVLITHHVDEIIPEIEHVVLMADGRVHAQGPKDSVLTGPHVSAAFAARAEVCAQPHGMFSAEFPDEA